MSRTPRTDDDNDSAAKLAARRSGLLKSGLPVFYRFPDLVAAGLVASRTSLLRLIDKQGFPPGIMTGRNTRVWRVNDIEEWIATRSTARKVTPQGARNPRAKRRAIAEAQP
jgi:predicted DNA-binding transcriptional regulator AlpA